MNTKVTKEEAKKPDAFLAEGRHFLDYVEKHTKSIGVALLVFIAFGVGVSLFEYFGKQKEMKAQDAYFQVEKSYLKLRDGFDRAQALITNPPKEAPKEAPKAASGDIEADYGTVINGFKIVLAEQKGSKAAQMAALNLYEIYSNYGKHAEAEAVLADVRGDKGLMGNLISVAYGTALANKGDCTKAIDAWQSVLSDKQASFLHEDLKIRMGICYESSGNLEKAKEMLEGARAKPDSQVGKLSEKYLRALNLKTN